MMIEKRMRERLAEEFGGCFWTRFDELIEDLEKSGYDVLESNREYIEVEDAREDDDGALIYLDSAGSTIWIRKIY